MITVSVTEVCSRRPAGGSGNYKVSGIDKYSQVGYYFKKTKAFLYGGVRALFLDSKQHNFSVRINQLAGAKRPPVRRRVRRERGIWVI